MKKTICILSAFAILLCLWLAALWLPALTDEGKPQSETRYGVSEGLESEKKVPGAKGISTARAS